MKLLFFDMEFANGQVPGSIYSIGYMMTDEHFQVLLPQTDLLMNPDCAWNEYVEENILAYPKEEVEAAPIFPAHYGMLKELFEGVDVAIGFAVNNDSRALRKNCERYALSPLRFQLFDTEKLCRMMEEHKEAHGLGGYVQAWCGEEPDNRHRSDGDAYATMLLFRAICRAKHVSADMMLKAYPECCGESTQSVKKAAKPSANHKKGTRRRRHGKPKNVATAPATAEA